MRGSFRIPTDIGPTPRNFPQCKRLTVSPPLGINRSLPSRKACSEREGVDRGGGQFFMIPVTHRGWGVVSGFFFFFFWRRGLTERRERERRCSQRHYNGSGDWQKSRTKECPHLFNLTLTADTTKCKMSAPQKARCKRLRLHLTPLTQKKKKKNQRAIVLLRLLRRVIRL